MLVVAYLSLAMHIVSDIDLEEEHHDCHICLVAGQLGNGLLQSDTPMPLGAAKFRPRNAAKSRVLSRTTTVYQSRAPPLHSSFVLNT